MPGTSRPRTPPSSRSNSSSKLSLTALRLTGSLIAFALAGQGLAQDRDALPSLEDLIPDAAIDAPEAWAEQIGDDVAPAPAPEDIEVDDLPEPDFDAPLDEFPPPPMEWPDETPLAEVEELDEEAFEFAELAEELQDPFADAEIERISSNLELAFPTDRALFPIRDEFIDRYKSLSAIEEFDSGDENLAVVSARAKADEELLTTLLRAYGYYDAQVARSVAGPLPGDEVDADRPTVRFAIVPGARYTYGAIELGDLASAPDAEVLRNAFEIRSGDDMSNFRIVEEQFDLDRALGEFGYPFAEIDAPELLVDHDRDEGDLTLAVRPNGKYVFGEVTSSMPRFLSGKHFGTIARFEPGDVYQRSLQMDLRRAVTATGLVSSVEVTPREVSAPSGDQPGVVAMDVEIQKAKLRTIAGAIGYGSEEGFRLQGSWEHRNFFPPEGAVRARAIAGTQEQLAGLTYRRNNFRGRDRVLNIDAYARSFDNDVYQADTAALVGSYEQASTLLFQKPLSWSIGMELVATDERDAKVKGGKNPRQTYLIAALPASVLVDASDDLLDPTKGFRIGARVSPEISRLSGSESTYLSAQLDGSVYKQINDRIILAGRTRLGTIVGAETFQIAPSRRLYAGGGSSVRGYGYQQIGPRNGVGDPNGGRSLVELSAEARIRTRFFDGALGVVPFVDAGSVSRSSTPDLDRIKIGAGVGLRYYTGFGPLRVDVGFPLNPGPDDSFVAVYVSLGQAF